MLNVHTSVTDFHRWSTFHYLGGRDYIRGYKTYTVKIGHKTQSFLIPIINDNILECDETFKVEILGVSLCGVTLGSVKAMDVTIVDDDSK